MREIIIGIYCIENKINNKKYIGQTINLDERLCDHLNKLNKNKHENIYLQRAWNKHGKNNFKFYLIQECPKELLNDLEMELIEEFNTTHIEFGYNLTKGGDGSYGRIISNETKNKISNSKKGKPFYFRNITSEEHGNILSKSQMHLKKSTNKHGHVGIYFDKNCSNNPWAAEIRLNKGEKRKHLGFYSTKEKAIEVWENAYFEHFGEKYNERRVL